MSSLLGSVTTFAALLRRQGFTAGPGEVAEALRAAEVLGLLDAPQLERAWGLIFARSRQQAELFPALFRAHFLQTADAAPRPQPPEIDTDPPPAGEETPAGETAQEVAETVQNQVIGPGDSPDDNSADDGPMLHTRLSPHAGQGAPPTVPPGEAQRFTEAAQALLRGVRLSHSRRYRRSTQGRRVDVRATLQAARRSGGEPLRLHYRARLPRPPRVVLLLDGSRSMTPYSALLLRYASALSVRSRKVEVYTFSTELARYTPTLRASQQPGSQRIESGASWGGGTRIGENLERLAVLGRAHLRPDTLLLILSDGLDTGEPQQLAQALARLRRGVGGVVWLNPLAAQAGYLPLARGMAAALPHLNVFAGLEGVDDLLSLPVKVRQALS